jgi:pyridoxal phosphate enzyme (YggS family)
MEFAVRLARIRERMETACRRAGRALESVRLIAVTKTRSVEEVAAAVSAGVVDLGENRVQEAEPKIEDLRSRAFPPAVNRPRWHLVGHLQKNKAKKAVALFDCIHSVDGIELGQRIDRAAAESEKVQPVLVQVDLAAEPTKFGVPEENLFPTLEALSLAHLRVEGLMVLPPFLPDPERVRPFFRHLAELGTDARARGLAGPELSMGMSHDFEIAIEEGATCIRVGTALFGPRAARRSEPASGGEERARTEERRETHGFEEPQARAQGESSSPEARSAGGGAPAH